MNYALKAIYTLLTAYDAVLFLRVILGWFSTTGFVARIYDVCYRLTEPVLRPIRSLLLRIELLQRLPLDLSPLIVFGLIALLQRFLYSLLIILTI